MTDPSIDSRLTHAAQSYRRIGYTGPALDRSRLNDVASESGRNWLPAGLITATAALVLMVLVIRDPGLGSGGFGQDFVESQSPYQALDLARRALERGGEPSVEDGELHQGPGAFRLPPVPRRASGFAPEPSQAKPGEVS